jgi:hypothetical protein
MKQQSQSPVLGEATLVFTDVETGAIRTEIRTNNVKYNGLFNVCQSLANSNYYVYDYGITPNIVIYSVSTPPSKYDWAGITATDGARATGFVDSSQISPQFFKATLTDPSYTQVVNRFSPPTSGPRYVRYIALQPNAVGTPQDTPLNTNYYTTSASITLDPPCIQSTTEVLDIFYRVITPYNPSGLMYPFAHEYVSNLIVGNPNSGSQNPINRILANIYTFDSTPLTSDIHTKYNTLQLYRANTQLGTADTDSYYPFANADNLSAPVISVRDLSASYSFPFALNTHVGAILATAHVGNAVDVYNSSTLIRYTVSSHNILNPGTSTIQPVHSHSSTGVRPFLDASFLATGSGKVVPVCTTPQSTFPEMYRINVTTGGDVGTAQYSFSMRYHQGFLGNTYTDKPESSHIGAQGTPNVLPNGEVHITSIIGAHGLTPTNPITYSQDGYAYGGGMQQKRYDNNTLMTYDATGLTKAAINSYDYVQNFDSTTTPALPVTNIVQVTPDPAGNVWVACSNTGLWKISADDSTVTRMTVAGVTDTACYGVDQSSTTLWAIFDGGLCSSTDFGSTWTVYNQSSSTVFSWSGITNSNWSSVAFIRVDYDHPDQRLLIIRKSTSGASSNAACWWSTTTSAASAHINELYGFTYSACNNQQDHLVQSRGGYWTVFSTNIYYPSEQTSGTSYLKLLTFGTTTVTPITGLGNLASGSMQDGFAPDKVTGLLKPIILTTSTSMTFGLVEPDGTVVHYVAQNPNNVTGQYNNYRPVQTSDRCIVYMGGGVLMYPYRVIGNVNPAGTYGSLGWFRIFVGSDGTPSGGYFGYLHWKNYGWNGSTWVQDYVGSKTMHSSQETLLNGITIGFTNGSSGTSFVSTDYYTFGRLFGVWKDNATTLTWSRTSYALNAITNIVNSGTVASRAAPMTVPTMIGRSGNNKNTATGKYHHSYVNNVTTQLGRAMTEGFLSGDFQLDLPITTPDCYNTMHIIGGFKPEIGRELNNFNPTEIPYGFSINQSGQLYYIYQNAYYLPYASAGNPVSGVTVTTGDVISIRRTSGVFYLLKNGTQVHTSGAAYSPATEVLSLSFVGYSGDTTRSIVPMTVSANGTEYSADLGSSISSTGKFDPKFINMIGTPSSVLKGTLNGTPAVMTMTNHPNPPVGEIHINPVAGKAYFNSADAGKVYNITSAYLQDF